MARGREQHIEHLLRRAAFGAVEDDVTSFAAIPFVSAVEPVAQLRTGSRRRGREDRDAGPRRRDRPRRQRLQPLTKSTMPGSAGCSGWCTASAPLQEKMALFGTTLRHRLYQVRRPYGAEDATPLLSAKTGEDGSGLVGQIELFRRFAVGNFRDC